MTQQSEERLPASTSESPPPSSTARILPFERPQSDLQRAIQVRAQEAIDRDRELEREERRPQPLKWLIIFAIALIPVILIFGAVDGFLRAFYKINETYNSAPAPASAEPAPDTNVQTTPGVVLLQPLDQAAAPEAAQTPAQPSPPKEESPPPRSN
jgi:hypothetical protein